MTLKTLIGRSLRYHLRSHAGVVIGVAIGSAALTGALVVGDSVRWTLTQNALARLGPTHYALFSADRLFATTLRQRICEPPSGGLGSTFATGMGYGRASVCPMAYGLVLPGVVSRQDGSARANQVTVLGVEDPAWPVMAGWGKLPDAGQSASALEHGVSDENARVNYPQGNNPIKTWRAGETAFINQALARQLNARAGDEIIVRIRKPSALGLDAAISPKNETTVSLRLKIGAILDQNMLGDFSLTPGQTPPANLFLPHETVRKQLNLEERANLLLMGQIVNVARRHSSWLDNQRFAIARWLIRWAPRQKSTNGRPNPWVGDPGSVVIRTARQVAPRGHLDGITSEEARAVLDERLKNVWLLGDAEIAVNAIEQPQSSTGGEYVQPVIEVSTSRIFLEDWVVSAALRPRPDLLSNHLGFEQDSTNDLRFSALVTNGFGVLTYLANLIQTGDRATPYSMITAAGPPFVPGDMRDDEIMINDWLAEDLSLRPGDSLRLVYYVVDSGARLTERTNAFRVRGIVPMQGRYADRTLMPEFPGVAKAESTHDWDTGFPLTYTIRDKDEAYWKKYRGTPKAFVTLKAGQAMWANRFGSLTAIRYEVPSNTFASTCRGAIYRNLLANLQPAMAGLQFEPVRDRALNAAKNSQDFGGLFLGFSFFLVVAALLLMALLFQFGLEQRAVETGTLLSLGFTPRRVRKLLMREGVAIASIGSIFGAFFGLAYARSMLWGLNTVWNRAVGGSALRFHATADTITGGFAASIAIAAVVIWFTLRKQGRQPASELLAGHSGGLQLGKRSFAKWIALAAAALGLGLLGWGFLSGERNNPDTFFGVGCLLLIAGLAASAAWLRSRVAAVPTALLSLSTLGLRNCARRRTRSLATIALLASGVFVISAIGVFRLDSARDSALKTSGTGGFALIGQSAMPVVKDLNTASGREFFGLSATDLAGVRFVPFRVREGEEASCLNLNRAQKPRVLGVSPELLQGRFTFTATAKGYDAKDGWRLLDRKAGQDPEVVPAIGDAASIEWALGKKLGDTVEYTDERGHSLKLLLVGAVANSIMQGNLIIAESKFIQHFPSESGYRMFLVDAAHVSAPAVSATLARALEDTGLELTPAVRKLDEFNAVQNTYLGTFQVLGGLGLLLGSAGLGIVVLRNVMERRGELALLAAVGFTRLRLGQLLLGEHGSLLGLGLALGVIAAAAAVLPDLLAPGGRLPFGSLAVTLSAVLLNGLLWTWVATRYALRGNLLSALRNE